MILTCSGERPGTLLNTLKRATRDSPPSSRTENCLAQNANIAEAERAKLHPESEKHSKPHQAQRACFPSAGAITQLQGAGVDVSIKARAMLGGGIESWDELGGSARSWGDEPSAHSPLQLGSHVLTPISEKGKQRRNLFHLIIVHFAQRGSQIRRSRSSSTDPTKRI